MAGNRFYEEGEAEEILRRALHQPESGAIDRERLLSMAAELGISEDAVARAEEQIAAEREAEASRAEIEADRVEFRRKRRAGFWSDLTSYIGVNGFMVGIWWVTGHNYFWPGWLLAAWGIGLVSDFAGAFFGYSEKDFERWRRKKGKRALVAAQSGRYASTDDFLDAVYPENRDQKLMMIKLLREEFNLPLKESKDTVDDYLRRRQNHGTVDRDELSVYIESLPAEARGSRATTAGLIRERFDVTRAEALELAEQHEQLKS